MAIAAHDVLTRERPIDDLYGSGPASKRLMRRALAIYGIVLVLGLVPLFWQAPASWQAFGIGLVFPAGGFLAVGGWSYLLFPVGLFLMLVALALVVLRAMVYAPVLVWLGSAVAAGALAKNSIEPSAAYVVPALALLFLGWVIDKHRRISRREMANRERRNAYLPRAEREVLERAAAVAAPGARELSAEELAHLRYALDRGLQPPEALDGFHVVEQFQTWSLRYQINNLLWPLQVAQCHYTPNFHGYLSQAQRNLIEKLTLPIVWKYWRWESLFGNLSLNADPIAKDNIMFGAFSSAHIALYTATTGDDRYLRPGSLAFRLNRFRTYRHSLQTILAVGRHNQRPAAYAPLYPCEPKLTFSACNLIGNFSHLVGDRIFGTEYRHKMLEQLRYMHVSEMMSRDGVVQVGRVNPLGIRIPVPSSAQIDALWSWLASAFFPDLSRRVWAALREEYVSFDDENNLIIATEKSLLMDRSGSRKSEVGPYTQFLVAAAEQGDERAVDAILRKFDRDFGRVERDGVVSYEEVTNQNMGLMIMGKILRTGDIRHMMTKGPPKSTLAGPILTGVRYPDVLVAKAFSDGTDLELVLYPGTSASGTSASRQALRFERLQPGRVYLAKAAADERPQSIQADAQGCASIDVDLHGRTAVRIAPVTG